MLLSILVLLLFLFYISGGFNKLLKAFEIQETPQDEIKRHEIQPPPKYNRMQLEKTAANCLYLNLTPKERAKINIFETCRNASDKELFEIIENFENY